jgi:transcriptional regulator
VVTPQEARIPVSDTKSEILQGTLDLMVLKTLEAMGPLHGYGIAVRLEQISADVIRFNQGTVYASLLRLVQQRWVSAQWGVSDNNRRAKFYTITSAGRGRLATEADEWRRVSGVITRLLQLAAVS